jgi:hypothetical protein
MSGAIGKAGGVMPTSPVSQEKAGASLRFITIFSQVCACPGRGPI